MAHPNDVWFCPLLNKDIFFGGVGGCYEIQEVRNDDMDMEFLPFDLDIEKANNVCERCKKYAEE